MASSSSATVAVEKATSDLLLGPDWTMNIEICDSINSHQWQSKDVVKAVKKRLQHKSSKVQLLALTLLETMVKNCGDFVHFQIVERNILEEMIKIVRKKADMQVRDKILVLLDSWQEAFGGPGGKHPQYYWAYEELRRSGVDFPKRSLDAAPIFTPPPTHPTLRYMQAGYGMPNNSLRRLDETIATETESLSLSRLDSMRHVMELLSDMLQAVNPRDHEALKDEVIVDLVERCRTNQKKLMQMLTTTGDEELLGRGLELNDSIQSLLARHDAIASGTPLPTQDASSSSQSTEAGSSSFNANEVGGSSPKNTGPTPKDPSAPLSSVTRGQIEEEEEEEDEFIQLARRHSKTETVPPKDATTVFGEGSISMNTSNVPEPSAAIPSNALAVVNPPAPVNTSKEQDIIDLLSITLSTSSVSSTTQQTPVVTQEMHQASVPSSSEGYPYASQTYSGNSSCNTYVVPWAQPQPKSPSSSPPQQVQGHHEPQHLQPQQQPQNIPSQPQPQSHLQNQHLRYSVPQTQPQPVNVLQPQVQSPLQNQHLQYSAPQPQPQPQPESHLQNQQHLQYSAAQQQLQPQHEPQQFQCQVQSQSQPQAAQQLHNQHLQYPSTYPPPPWATTPGYPTNQNQRSATNMYSTSRTNTMAASYTPAQAVRPLQHDNAFPSGGGPQWNSGPGNPASATGQKPFIPSYRLFEDLNVFGNTDGRIKMTNGGTSSSRSGTMGPGMVGGRK